MESKYIDTIIIQDAVHKSNRDTRTRICNTRASLCSALLEHDAVVEVSG